MQQAWTFGDFRLPVRHKAGCPGAIVPGVGYVIDRSLGSAEVERRLAWLEKQLVSGSRRKVFRKA